MRSSGFVFAVVLLLLAAPAAEAHWFGHAFNVYTGATSRTRFKPRVSGSQANGQLRCARPRGVCNGRVGRIDGALTGPPGGLRTFVGTLGYAGAGVVCRLACEVTRLPSGPRDPGPDSFWSCVWDQCQGPARVPTGTFTTQRF